MHCLWRGGRISLPVEIWLLIAKDLGEQDARSLSSTSQPMNNLLQPKLLGYQLLKLVSSGDESSVMAFLQENNMIDFEVVDHHDTTVLFYAVARGYDKLLEALMRRPSHKRLLNIHELRRLNTPLTFAAQYRNSRIVRTLLNAGANVNAQNADNEGALFWAIKRNNFGLARLILDMGSDPDQTIREGLTPLLLAILKNDHDLVTLLVDKGADLEKPDQVGQNPLAWAVIMNNLTITRTLLDYGACVRHADRQRRSPLVWAIMKGDPEMVQLLLTRGANAQEVHNDGRSPLIWSIIRRSLPVARMLLAYGARVEVTDKEGRTPLLWAVIYNNLPMVQLLLSHGADPRQGEVREPSAWNQNRWKRARDGIKPVFQVNWRQGPGLDLEVDRGPILLAAVNGNIEMVYALVAAARNDK